MTKRRVALTLNCFLLLALLLASCSGLPGLRTPTPAIPTPTSFQQSLPPALVETDPPLGSVIGHQSPITFYFNEAVNKSSAESALTGLPAGTFAWTDEATLVFTPTQPYQPNTTLDFSIASSLQSANGFGIAAPIELSFTVADYLRATNFLPKPDAEDVNVDAAIAVSFNQPVVALGGDSSKQPSAFTLQPSVKGRGEWINTSTYIFYPEPALTGGTEYTVSLNPELKTVTGVGFVSSEASTWKFTTSKPRVVKLEPSIEQLLPLDPEIKLTFNQSMNTQSVESSFSFRGTEGALKGKFSWNKDQTEMTFIPDDLLGRNVGYILNLGATAQSKGGLILGADYGAVFTTYDNFTVAATKTGTKTDFNATSFTFNAPLAKANYDKLVTVSPDVDNLHAVASDDGLSLTIYADFIPDTNYAIELSARIKDRWGQSLGDPFKVDVHTPPMPSTLNVPLYGWSMSFVRPDEAVLYANAVNIQNTNTTVAPLSLQDFFSLQNSHDDQQAYVPNDSHTYPQSFNLPPGGPSDIKLNLAQRNNQLLPGLYYVEVSSPQITSTTKDIYLVASSQVNLTFKLGATDALVWAVDLPSQTPIADAPVTIYDEAGTAIGSGTTDEHGVWKGAVSAHNSQVFALLGAPGDENFGLAVDQWGWGLDAWNFGYSQHVQPPHTEIYMYTDRPIYRPGQTIYFRGVARQAFNGRYELPQVNTVQLQLQDSNGVQLSNFDMQLSPYGTFNGEFKLAEDAAPGYYTFQSGTLEYYFSFQVAEYRKPEINLNVNFSADEIKLGDASTATVNARYFFDAPVSDTKIQWALYTKPDYFNLPNYRTGLVDTSWLDVFHEPGSSYYFGKLIDSGDGQTDPQGLLSIELPAIPESDSGQLVTLEVTAQDESGLPVSARAQMHVHPADFYVGLRPEQWIGRANSPMGFEVYTVDWKQNPSGDKKLTAEFKQVRWEKQTDSAGFPTYTPVYLPGSSSDLVTGADGKARLSFTPPTSGTYLLDVSGEGAHAQTLVWVGGAGSAAWPDLPDQRLELTADRDSYKPGDTATIFIPNPFAVNALALVTVERGLVSQAEVIKLNGSGREYSLTLSEDDAPNVYVSVTVLGQGNDFRYGLVNIPVAPDAEALNVQVVPNPTQAGPRDEVTFGVQVTDNQGKPVQGEFSLSVVDLASLALADSNAEDILPAFYSNQPLGVETGLSLAGYTGRGASQPGGMGGGGGGEETPVIREDFPDTAYWNPSLITNSDGRGQVTMTLPDSLTTWQVDVRGLTVDTKVGQAETQIVATKPLLIRPVTPRFLVSGDHVLLAAVVNNNTASRLTADVNLQSEGFVLDEPDKATQQVDVPAHGRARVEWWGTAGTESTADLVFSAKATGTSPLEDSTRPTWGALPIKKYTSPQAFVTGGVLREASSQQEVISLPRTFSPSGGGLDVELSPSLAASLLSALEAMDLPDATMSAEATLSYLLPNLEVYRALNGAGLSDPKLSERVTEDVTTSVSRLLSLQNEDGGWSWWGKSEKSDPYISAYIFFGLLRTHEIGMSVDESALQRAGTYLSGLNPAITNDTSGAKLDETTFIQFVLAYANTFDEATIGNLYNMRDRLSPASKALLAYIFNKENPADERVRDLISNLESSAVMSASGAHWETPRENIFTTGSSLYTTSVVVYVLAQLDSANQVVFNAVRYLAAHRNVRGLWGMGYENAWAMLALNEAMVGFGDLNADFAFHATLNGGPLANGDISGNQVLTPTTAQVPLEYLSPNSPNLLTIQREEGLGRLYYRAVLNVSRPVEDVRPLNDGMQIERVYCREQLKRCTPLSTLALGEDQPISARLTLVLPHDAYYVMVEDSIPAGMEILNRSLKTSQQGTDTTDGVQVQFDDSDPFAEGWGWWLFHEPQIRDDGILFTADHLPAGTYVLTYTLIPLQAGEYRVLPAHAWEAFFPEVQGTSAGAVFEIKP